MRKVLYISGTRADYGLMESVLFAIKNHPDLEIEIAVTGMHLMPEFGNTFKEIKDFKIHKIKAVYKKDDRASMAEFLGKCVVKLTKEVEAINPDIILLLGDRAEMLAGAVVGHYLGIPVAQMHGGEITSTVDDKTRNAIAKLANIHLPATKASGERIAKMGEDNIFVVGAPGLDNMKDLIPKEEIAKKYDIDLGKPILLVLQHPVTGEGNKMRETMEAIKDYQSIVIYPNADAGGREMIKTIQEYDVKSFKNISRKDFLSLLNISILVGNSSCGMIESSGLHIPVINIGLRQQGRERGSNVLDVRNNKEEIKAAIEKALHNEEFKRQVQECTNPWGDGKTGPRVARVLNEIKL